jgi:hypothetical protein
MATQDDIFGALAKTEFQATDFKREVLQTTLETRLFRSCTHGLLSRLLYFRKLRGGLQTASRASVIRNAWLHSHSSTCTNLRWKESRLPAPYLFLFYMIFQELLLQVSLL